MITLLHNQKTKKRKKDNTKI